MQLRITNPSKRQYKGTEFKGKTRGVLGLRAIGSMAADLALQIDMNVQTLPQTEVTLGLPQS